MKLSQELLSLLKEVVREQCPDLLPSIEQLAHNRLPSRVEADLLVDIIFSEVARTGFFETDESIKRGLMLEEIGDFLCDADYDDSN